MIAKTITSFSLGLMMVFYFSSCRQRDDISQLKTIVTEKNSTKKRLWLVKDPVSSSEIICRRTCTDLEYKNSCDDACSQMRVDKDACIKASESRPLSNLFELKGKSKPSQIEFSELIPHFVEALRQTKIMKTPEKQSSDFDSLIDALFNSKNSVEVPEVNPLAFVYADDNKEDLGQKYCLGVPKTENLVLSDDVSFSIQKVLVNPNARTCKVIYSLNEENCSASFTINYTDDSSINSKRTETFREFLEMGSEKVVERYPCANQSISNIFTNLSDVVLKCGSAVRVLKDVWPIQIE